jgi:hypothetical protein
VNFALMMAEADNGYEGLPELVESGTEHESAAEHESDPGCPRSTDKNEQHMAFQAGVRAKEFCLAQEATNKGKAVVDSGATKSLGGIDALEKLAKRNAKRHGRTSMAVDLADCPTFTFGNGRQAKVNGRATFEIEAKGQRGTFDIHGLNAKGVPILVSIDTLAKMGAVIDFRTGRAIYQALDPNAIIQLESDHSPPPDGPGRGPAQGRGATKPRGCWDATLGCSELFGHGGQPHAEGQLRGGRRQPKGSRRHGLLGTAPHAGKTYGRRRGKSRRQADDRHRDSNVSLRESRG